MNKMVTDIAVEMPTGIVQPEQENIDGIEYPKQTIGTPLLESSKMSMRNVDVFYGDKQAIFNVNVDIGQHEVIAMIGPSGCGKSTFIRSINRMNDTVESCKVTGQLTLDGEDIYSTKIVF